MATASLSDTTTLSDTAPSATTPWDTTAEQVRETVRLAAQAAPVWAATSRADRAAALRAVADRLDAAADELVVIACAETHLAEGRLRGELVRTTFQLRLFAEVLVEGDYLDARVDHVDQDWPMGAPRPDLRRMLEPVGPVIVFAASNFPFAFSVAGGDTASALAAGCPVVLKAHPGHPQLSTSTGLLVKEALAAVGAPTGVFALIFGFEAGRVALVAPDVRAGAFTGSLRAGRALFDLAVSRPEPIAFFGELGSVNPVFVTRAAAAARPAEIVEEAVASFTMGAGQFCTKPGLLLVPATSSIPDLLAQSELPGPAPLLNPAIESGYAGSLAALVAHPGVDVVAGPEAAASGSPAPTVLTTTAAQLLAAPTELVEECFGPTLLVVRYDDDAELAQLATGLEGQLTATVIGEPVDAADPAVAALTRILATKAGRLLWNGWPTGVSVSYAQQHGGPYPATTAPGSTSVGTAAIGRFLRPVAYQGFPEALLPVELSDAAPAGLLRRIDGRSGR